MNGARPIKRRRTKPEMQAVRGAIHSTLADDYPMTVRQLYCRIVGAEIIGKTKAQYDTVCRLLAMIRRDGQILHDWIDDATRWMRKQTAPGKGPQVIELYEKKRAPRQRGPKQVHLHGWYL